MLISGLSVCAGVVVFSLIGFYATALHERINEVASGGTFVVVKTITFCNL